MTDITVSAEAAFDRTLYWTGGASVRHLVIRLRARRENMARPAERSPLNIALVIDRSGSMARGKLEAAKAAALGLAERLTGRDRLTIVSFASDVVVHLNAVPVNGENLVRIGAELARMEASGNTCLSGGWTAGVECAARFAETEPGMTPRVILLSDGHANEGIVNPLALRDLADNARRRGILTSTLGIGDGYDEQLLAGMAEFGGGRLHDAELAGEIGSVLLGELDEIAGTVVDDAGITLALPPGVSVEPVGRGQALARPGSITQSLGPLRHDTERLAVVKITCPRGRAGDLLSFELSAAGRAADDGVRLDAPGVSVRLVAAESDANSAQTRNRELAEIVARTWSAHVVSLAARMNRDGAWAEAAAFVAGELVHFRRYAEGLAGGEAMIAELELLAAHIDRPVSSRSRKEMVLQSALLMESRLDWRGPKAAWKDRLEGGD